MSWKAEVHYSRMDPQQYEEERFGSPVGEWIDGLEKEAVIKLARLEVGDTVLDVACGTGRLIEAVAHYPRVKEIVGVDINENMLALAREKFGGDSRVNFICGDVYHLPFGPGQFRKVVGGRIFMHLDDKEKFLKEVRRILTPGGVLVFDFLNRHSLLSLLRLPFLKGRGWGLDPQKKFSSWGEVTALASRNNFELETSQPLLLLGETWYRKFPSLVGILGSVDKFLCSFFPGRLATKMVVALRLRAVITDEV